LRSLLTIDAKSLKLTQLY